MRAEPFAVTMRSCPVGKVIWKPEVMVPVTVTPTPTPAMASMAVSIVAVAALKASALVVPRTVPAESATVMVNVPPVVPPGLPTRAELAIAPGAST